MSVPFIPTPFSQLASSAGSGIAAILEARNQRRWREVELAQQAVDRQLELVARGVVPRATIQSPEFQNAWRTAQYGNAPSAVVPNPQELIAAELSANTREASEMRMAPYRLPMFQARIAEDEAGASPERVQMELETGRYQAAARPDAARVRAAGEAEAEAAVPVAGMKKLVAETVSGAIPGSTGVMPPGFGGLTARQIAALQALGVPISGTSAYERAMISQLTQGNRADEAAINRDISALMRQTRFSLSRPIVSALVRGDAEVVTEERATPRSRQMGIQLPPRMVIRFQDRNGRPSSIMLNEQQSRAVTDWQQANLTRQVGELENRYLQWQRLASDDNASAVDREYARTQATQYRDALLQLRGATPTTTIGTGPRPQVGAGFANTMLPPTGGGTEATTVATTTRGPNNGNIVPSLVGAFTQDAIMQRILMQYLTPQVAQALMNRDIQGARSIAMAAARVGNQDAEQRRQATEALTHFFDYLAQEEPTR